MWGSESFHEVKYGPEFIGCFCWRRACKAVAKLVDCLVGMERLRDISWHVKSSCCTAQVVQRELRPRLATVQAFLDRPLSLSLERSTRTRQALGVLKAIAVGGTAVAGRCFSLLGASVRCPEYYS